MDSNFVLILSVVALYGIYMGVPGIVTAARATVRRRVNDAVNNRPQCRASQRRRVNRRVGVG